MIGRAALALARAKGDRMQAARIADLEQAQWGSLPADYLRAATPAGSRDGWGNPLVEQGVLEFLELVQQQSLIGRVGFQDVPANTRLVAATGRGVAAFVGEGAPKPVTDPALEALGTLAPYKCVGLTFLTDEVVRAGGPAADRLVTSMLANACAFTMDQALTDPANMGDASQPPYLGHGATPVTPTGDLATDVVTALGQLTSTANAVILMNSLDAAKAAAMRSGNGAPLYPDIGPRGGSLLTIPVFVSDATPAGVVIVLDPTRIGVYNGPVEIRYSNQATVQLTTTPDDPTGAGTVMTSLWHANLHGLLTEVLASWLVPSSGAVAVITGALTEAPAVSP